MCVPIRPMAVPVSLVLTKEVFMETLFDVFSRLQFPHWIWNLDRNVAVRYHADGSLWVLDMNHSREYPAQSFDEVVTIVGQRTASQYAWAFRAM